eukprot:m.16167 g.16167  ORF g.16167 m.16167 type:complete len:70 (+) comp7962_c0_seq1:126-335(+)
MYLQQHNSSACKWVALAHQSLESKVHQSAKKKPNSERECHKGSTDCREMGIDQSWSVFHTQIRQVAIGN